MSAEARPGPDSLVSVVIPAFRHEAYVEACLRSVAAQTHGRMELLFLDDRSPDRTFEVARDLLEGPLRTRFERVVCLRKEGNGGAHDSINLGVGMAAGSHVAILNSDDLFHPLRLERLLAGLAAQGSAFAFSAAATIWDGGGDPAGAGPGDYFLLLGPRTVAEVASAPSVGFALLRRNVALSTGNFLFARDLARRVGPFLPLRYCHDWDFVLQATRFTEPVFVPEPLYSYRLHPQNSFRGYQHLNQIEVEVVLRRFFAAVLRWPTPNGLCPSPRNWPGVFESWAARFCGEEMLLAEAEMPARHSRTVARGAPARDAAELAQQKRAMAARVARRQAEATSKDRPA
ncbi:glycosyltransferase family 2 protein [Roseococcus sp. DSY-14]|uniref:glycosyltransferase family 2 protein n=1 Tax=Roseococcus sp. DSY-14 TaxID=3369650 RepID=UPI00387B5C8E